MSFEQIYYTSCQNGIRGGMGFQVNAATPGLPLAVIDLVERLGVYAPPSSYPSRPSPDELDRFPVSLIYDDLGDGRVVLAQARYTGKDYSGRFGNYFTHSLVTSRAALAEEGLLPIVLWRSPGWSTQESPSVDLPELTAAQVAPGPGMDLGAVRDFVLQDGRIEQLPAFLGAVEQALATSRRIILVGDADTIAKWIAAASFAFPQRLALELTFNTYVKNPYQTSVRICGVLSRTDCDFGFQPREINHQYYVFDFRDGVMSPVGTISSFARGLAHAYETGSLEDVVGFARFADEIAPELAVEELSLAYACHGLASDRDPAVDRIALLRWCCPRMGLLSPTVLSKAIKGAMSADPANPDAVDTYGRLYRESMQPGLSPDRQALVQQNYLEWLVTAFVPMGALDDVGKLLRGLHVPDSARAAAIQLRDAWLGRLQASVEPVRLGLLLRLGEVLGYLDEGGELAQKIGHAALGPALVHPGAPDLLRRLLERPWGHGALLGVARHLEEKATDIPLFQSLGPVLASPDLGRFLLDIAKRNRSRGLVCHIIGAMAAGRPAGRFQALGAAFRHCGEMRGGPAAEDLALAFHAIWQGAVPSLPEALQAVEGYGDLLVTAGLLDPILRSLLGGGLRDADDQRRQLANRLLEAFPEQLGDRGPHVHAYQIASRLDSGLDPLAAVRDAIGILESLPDGLRAELVESAASVLPNVHDPDEHSRLLDSAYHADERFMAAYEQAVTARLGGTPVASPADVARLFDTWRRLGPSEQEPRNRLEGVLSGAFARWRVGQTVLSRAIGRVRTKRKVEAVAAAFGEDAGARREWLEWADRYMGPGIFARLKSWWLSGGALLARVAGKFRRHGEGDQSRGKGFRRTPSGCSRSYKRK